MHETPEDMAALQELLDRSYAWAGSHLRSIITPERRVPAQQLVAQLTGMRLLALATVTSDCRPLVSPVDGLFYKGSFHFGTSADSLRLRHVRSRPHVSATHIPGEEFAVTVHGRAVPVDIRTSAGTGLRRYILEVYRPRYGPAFEREFLDAGPRPPAYVRIDADRMFTFQTR